MDSNGTVNLDQVEELELRTTGKKSPPPVVRPKGRRNCTIPADTKRSFWFDPDSYQANYRRILVEATDDAGRHVFFMIAADGTEGGDSDFLLYPFRSHGAPPNTEVIVALLPREPMRSRQERTVREKISSAIWSRELFPGEADRGSVFSIPPYRTIPTRE